MNCFINQCSPWSPTELSRLNVVPTFHHKKLSPLTVSRPAPHPFIFLLRSYGVAFVFALLRAGKKQSGSRNLLSFLLLFRCVATAFSKKSFIPKSSKGEVKLSIRSMLPTYLPPAYYITSTVTLFVNVRPPGQSDSECQNPKPCNVPVILS